SENYLSSRYDFIPSLFRFFFLRLLRPPRSTLFPYTRSSDLSWLHRGIGAGNGTGLGRCITQTLQHQRQWHCLFRNRRHRRSGTRDRKSTRLNSSHVKISYAVFCLKKKKVTETTSDV